MEVHKFTKENPGSFKDLVDYLSVLGAESKFNIVTLNAKKYDDLPREMHKKKKPLIFPLRQCIGILDLRFIEKVQDNVIHRFTGIETIKGGDRRLLVDAKGGNGFKVPVDVQWDAILYYTYKKWNKDFKWSKLIKTAGKYKDWEGDGYYVIDLYELEGRFFAPGMITSSDGRIESISNEEIIKYLTS